MAGLLSKLLPGEAGEKAAALEDRMELVRFLAKEWESLASKARDIKSSLDVNISADKKEIAELGQEIVELVKAIRAAFP
jgi:malate synthase